MFFFTGVGVIHHSHSCGVESSITTPLELHEIILILHSLGAPWSDLCVQPSLLGIPYSRDCLTCHTSKDVELHPTAPHQVVMMELKGENPPTISAQDYRNRPSGSWRRDMASLSGTASEYSLFPSITAHVSCELISIGHSRYCGSHVALYSCIGQDYTNTEDL